MPPRSVSIGHGLQWIASGWRLFKRSPMVWIVLSLSLILIWLFLLSIPKLGPLLFNLLFPIFFAGLMLGCRALEQGGKLEFSHLFAGFRENAASLVTVGGVYLVGILVVLMIVTSSGNLPQVPEKPTADDITALQNDLRNMTGPILAGMALYVPLMMLTLFAPLLIVFQRMNAVPALKTSFAACLQNLGAFTLYALALLAIWVVATLPVIGVVLALPVIAASVYASYTDIFEQPPAEALRPEPRDSG